MSEGKENKQDIVRVLRILEYVGPREWIEKTVSNSIHGTKRFPSIENCYINGATLGTYPEIVARGVLEVRDVVSRPQVYAVGLPSASAVGTYNMMAGPTKDLDKLLLGYVPAYDNEVILDVTNPEEPKAIHIWSQLGNIWAKCPSVPSESPDTGTASDKSNSTTKDT